jgi:hypothetical protein
LRTPRVFTLSVPLFLSFLCTGIQGVCAGWERGNNDRDFPFRFPPPPVIQRPKKYKDIHVRAHPFFRDSEQPWDATTNHATLSRYNSWYGQSVGCHFSTLSKHHVFNSSRKYMIHAVRNATEDPDVIKSHAGLRKDTRYGTDHNNRSPLLVVGAAMAHEASADDAMVESRDEMESRHKKESKQLEGEHRAALKKAKGTKGKKAKEEVTRYVLCARLSRTTHLALQATADDCRSVNVLYGLIGLPDCS